MPYHDLMPEDPSRGWSGLTGYRRYAFRPQRLESRRAVIPFLEGVGIAVRSGDPSTLSINALRLNSFFAAHLKAVHLHVSWTRDRLTSQSRYLYLFVSEGMVKFLGDSERVVSDGGGLCIVFPGQTPVDLLIRTAAEMMVFTFDEKEILPLSLSPSNTGRLSASSTVFRAAFACLQAITAPHHEGTDSDSLVLRALTRDVARAVIAEAASRQHAGPLFDTAQRIISEQALDSQFTVQDLANACGVSRRTLYRAYASRDTSPSAELKRQRLDRALDALESHPHTPLAKIAAASGFGSVPTLERALRATQAVSIHTVPPPELRAGARPDRQVAL